MKTNREVLQRLSVGVFALVIVLTSTVLFAVLHRDDGIKKVRFSLQDHNAIARSEESFQGQWLLVSFGFTNCPDICPTQLMMITQALNRLDANGEILVPVFITVDPQNDTPEQLKRYLTSFHKDYIGLTGTEVQTNSVANSFKAFYKTSPETEHSPAQVEHTSAIYLVDPSRNIVQHYLPGITAGKLANELRNEI